jgi:hypothetical protein
MKIINDPFWKSLMGDDDNAWDDGGDQPMASSTTHDDDALDDGGDQPMADTSTHGDEGIGDEMVNNEMDGDEEVGHEGDGDEEVGNVDVGDEDVQDVEFDDEGDEESESATHTLCTADQLLKDEEEDTSSSKFMRSDILVCPSNSDDDDDNRVVSKARCVPTFVEFHDVDMTYPKLHIGMSFTSAKQFRQVVRTYNLMKGEDVEFTKNDGDRVIGICRSKSEVCPWRVYGSLVPGEFTFMVKSLNPTHNCTRKYKSSIVTSKWIADRMVNKFMAHPNYPLKTLCEDVKNKWNVDVTNR